MSVKLAGSAAFDGIVRDFAVLVFYIDVIIDVWIGPLHLCHCSADLDRLARIVLRRKRVVRQNDQRRETNKGSEDRPLPPGLVRDLWRLDRR